MKVTVTSPAQSKADAFVVGVTTKDEKRAAPGLKTVGAADSAAVKALLANKKVGLGLGQTQTVLHGDATLVLVGLGEISKLTQEKLGNAMNAGLKAAKAQGRSKVATTLLADAGMDLSVAAQAMVHGAIMGDLEFDQYKSKKDAKKETPKAAVASLQILADKPAPLRARVAAAATIAEAVNDARLIANTPANIATPKWMAAQARARSKAGFTVAVKGRAQLRKEGFNALCGVAQGSVNEEQLITMTYTPKTVTKATKTLVIVGKGVCFDSGGISLKPGQGMWEMKYDKCGASNVIAMMAAVAKLKPKHKVIGIAPCVENMPSGTAQRPGDIVTAKDGTTIEVLNTDAEGRLILADAITYGRTLKPTWMIEMSTLTGACEVAVGKTYVAAMGKNDAFVDSVIDAAGRAGDKAWKLPQGEEFDEGNKGTYADIQNISLKVRAGTSIGGSFVGHFAKDTPFCHLDIASKAWVDGQDYFGKGPTGAGLRIAMQRILDE